MYRWSFENLGKNLVLSLFKFATLKKHPEREEWRCVTESELQSLEREVAVPEIEGPVSGSGGPGKMWPHSSLKDLLVSDRRKSESWFVALIRRNLVFTATHRHWFQWYS